jgi:hypothetical protein
MPATHLMPADELNEVLWFEETIYFLLVISAVMTREIDIGLILMNVRLETVPSMGEEARRPRITLRSPCLALTRVKVSRHRPYSLPDSLLLNKL